MPRPEPQEFSQEHGVTRYPFSDLATMISRQGMLIDPEAFLDASLFPQTAIDGNLFISEIISAPPLMTIRIGTEEDTRLLYGEFQPLNNTGTIRIYDSYDRAAGLLVGNTDSLSLFQAWPTGTYTFEPTACPFAVTTIIPMPEDGVRGFLDEDGGFLAHDVWLVGENGIVLREDGGAIRVDAVGDPLFIRKKCEDTGTFTTPRFLSTINGIPSDNGSWTFMAGGEIAPDTIFKIYPQEGRLVLELIGQKAGG